MSEPAAVPEHPDVPDEPGVPDEPAQPEADEHEHVEPPDLDPPLDPVGEPRRYPSTIGGAFYLLVLVTAGTALFLTATDDWRLGVRVLAGGLGAGALLRLVLRQRDAGMLSVRQRWFDVLLLAGVGAVLWWLAGSIPDQPQLP